MFTNEDKKDELEDCQLEKWEEDVKYRIKDWGYCQAPYYLHLHTNIDTELERFQDVQIVDIIIKPKTVLFDVGFLYPYKGQRNDGAFEVTRSNFKKLINGEILSDKRKRIDYHISQNKVKDTKYWQWLDSKK